MPPSIILWWRNEASEKYNEWLKVKGQEGIPEGKGKQVF